LHVEQSRSRGSLGGTNLQALQNQIEQLNVFRESNTTLRNDAARLETKLAEKSKEFENLHAELEPLRTRVEQLEGELELTAGYLDQEKKQRDYWEKRFDKFVNKSEHIDPKEMEDLKKETEDVKAERDQYAEQITGLQDRIKTLEEGVEAAVEAAKTLQKDDLRAKFNKRHKQLMEAAIEPKQTEINSLTAERDQLQTSLTTLQQELETSRQQTADAQGQATQSQEQATALQQQVTLLQSQLATVQQEVEAVKSARDEAVARATVGANPSADVSMGEEGQINEVDAQASDQQLAELQRKLEEVKVQLTEAQNRAFRAENDYSALKVKESFMKDQVTKLEKDDVSSIYVFPCNRFLIAYRPRRAIAS
jgi:nucleoprotein TPR